MKNVWVVLLQEVDCAAVLAGVFDNEPSKEFLRRYLSPPVAGGQWKNSEHYMLESGHEYIEVTPAPIKKADTNGD